LNVGAGRTDNEYKAAIRCPCYLRLQVVQGQKALKDLTGPGVSIF
jgi:hypothetical protein